jgi:transposase
VAFPLLFIVAVVDLLTMSKARRVRIHRRSGKTWAAISQRFNVSPSTVRRWSMA